MTLDTLRKRVALYAVSVPHPDSERIFEVYSEEVRRVIRMHETWAMWCVLFPEIPEIFGGRVCTPVVSTEPVEYVTIPDGRQLPACRGYDRGGVRCPGGVGSKGRCTYCNWDQGKP